MPNIVVAFRPKEAGKTPAELADDALKLLPDNIKGAVKTMDYDLAGRKVKVLMGPNLTLCFAEHSGYTVISTSLTGIGQLKKPGDKEGQQPLSESKLYKKSLEKSGGDGGFFLFINYEMLAGLLKVGVPDPEMLNAMTALGFFDVKSVSFSSRFDGEGLKDFMRVESPAKGRKGVLNLFSLPPVDDGALDGLPADCDFALAANVPPAMVWREIKKMAVGAGGENGKEEMERAEGEFVETMGMKLDEFLASFDGKILIYSRDDATYLKIGLADPERFKKFIESLNAVMKQEKSEFKAIPYMGETLYCLDTAEPLPFPVSFFIKDKTLTVAATPQALKSFILDSQKKVKRASLTGNEDFKKVTGRVRGRNNFLLLYADLRKNFKSSYGLLAPALSMAKSIPGSSIEHEKLPPVGDIEKHFFGLALAASSDDDGLELACYSPLGSAGLPVAVAGNMHMMTMLAYSAVIPTIMMRQAMEEAMRRNLEEIGEPGVPEVVPPQPVLPPEIVPPDEGF